MASRTLFGMVPVMLALSACASSGASVASDADVAQKSAALADRFQADLQGQLQAAMQQGGPVGAIAVCHEVAPAIAQSLSDESGAQVRRIALRQRNPAALAEGELRAKLETLAAAPLGPDGKPASLQWTSGTGKAARVHYLRAIPMKEQPCAACHGTNVAPQVQARIAELYPDDRATGFRPGELRGAIAISWPASVGQ
ncbi:MAG: hypothetical protein B7Y36_16405 [Novosphingobium sp. 28-62-57]|uniref:c-type heme family protein n=1 Tax=unclassified Novosphingobium TaxID=2644732 RepID=UPI000BD59CEB|nr:MULTISPECIES: DUF3365 domain-containing protein [unclassified Novosphingobium]OYW48132.1 MAG: hypothetical protein B7Z36_00240 [Novosphingobium sp. 12-63-9]OYZ08582.1 MAG: hypothetical protein B7Y36_16405 [Novosphingobium sp. 28-62-57]OZA33881.1 MAG: hypothetical protein B7X92_10890 [Novosphingobium sp. 17-62-9]HQS71187.1 DUF3365 domain-containing protein [Novosphingobium sp.]